MTAVKPTTYDPATDINKMKELQKQQSLASLKQSRDSSLSSLNSEKTAIQPKYYDARNQTSSASNLQAKNFSEYLAGRGMTGNGANAQAELSRNVSLQGNLGALRKQEAADYSDIARRTTDVNTQYNNNLANAYAGIEANAAQQLINANQTNYQNLLNQYNTDRGYDYQVGRDTVADNQWKTNYDYQTNRDKVADGQWNQQYNYQVGRDQVADNEWNKQYTYQVGRDNVADNQWNKQYNYQTGRDQVSDSQWNQQFNYQKSQDTLDRAAGTTTNKPTTNASYTPTTQYYDTSKNNNTNLAWQSFNNVVKQGKSAVGTWLTTYKEQLIKQVGKDEYNRMYNSYYTM